MSDVRLEAKMIPSAHSKNLRSKRGRKLIRRDTRENGLWSSWEKSQNINPNHPLALSTLSPYSYEDSTGMLLPNKEYKNI